MTIQQRIEDTSQTIVNDLLVGIEYGDSRDNPEWQEKVCVSAQNVVSKELEKLVNNALMDAPDDIGGWEIGETAQNVALTVYTFVVFIISAIIGGALAHFIL